MFRGYDMAKIHFEMLEDVLPNQEHQFLGCDVAYEINIMDPWSDSNMNSIFFN